MREKLTILNRPLRVMHIISGDLWAGAEVQAFTLLKHLHSATTLHVVLMNDGELSRRLESLEIPVTIISESEFSSIQILTKLIKIIREFKPDALHTHRQKENILGNIANLLSSLPFGKRAASVRTAHGAPEFAPKGKQKIQIWMDNWVGKYLQQGVIAVSNELAEKLSFIFPADKVHVIHNGVDCDALKANATIADFRQNAPGHKHVGIIGRIEPVKRIDIFIEMADLLLKNKDAQPPLQFHVIGNGSLRSIMEEKTSQLNIEEYVHFHGHREDMASCISSLDVIVMCSDHEGTPMTALEAVGLGTPVVAHKTGGLIDILNGDPDLLVTNHSAKGYKEKIYNLLISCKRPMRLQKQYTAEENRNATLALYNAL